MAIFTAAVLGTLTPAESRTAAATAAPRAVTPRGPLGADEQANIELFKRLSPSVVHITTLETQRDMFSMNVMQVPRGTGTGFVWDDMGHIVTNFHAQLEQRAPGESVTLTLWRGGQSRKVVVVLAAGE